MKYFAIDYFKTISFFSVFILLSMSSRSQTISIPDAEFERYLVEQGIDSDGVINMSIPEADVVGVIELNMDGFDVADFNGIQSFSDLRLFEMRNNEGLLNNINFENNLLLEEIRIYSAPNLADINVSQNSLLNYLVVNTNGNFFNTINVLNNVNLDLLVIRGSNLLNLNVTNNVNLTYIDVGLNPLSSIDISTLNQLEFLIVDRTSIQNLDLSENSSLTYFNGLDCQLNYVNLQNGSNNILNVVWLTENPDLTCILVDDVNYAENAPNWSIDETASYVESSIVFELFPQNTFVQDDGFGNQAQVESWFNNNGGGTIAENCANATWSYTYHIILEPNQNGTDIFYDTVFTVTNDLGNVESTQASFVIEGIKHFTDFTYGTGETICDDQYDVNTVIVDIEPEASLNSSEIVGILFSREPNFESNEGPPGESFNATVVDFPDTGAGSYSYLFKVEIQKSIPLFRPENGEFDSVVIEDEAFITLNDKTVAFETDELDDIAVCPGEISSIQDLTDRLTIFPDPELLAPQEPIDLNQYWTPAVYSGTGEYVFDPTDAFPNCPSNALTVFVFEEEELDAGDDVLDAVDDSPYVCGDTVFFDLSTYLNDFADIGGRWYDSNDVELSSSIVEFPDTGAGQFTKSFSYRQENLTCGFFSEAAYDVTYDVAGLSTGTSSTIEICSGTTITEQELLDELGADSGGSWSPSLNPTNVALGTYIYSHGDCGTAGDTSIELSAVDCTILLSTKIYLQGASINPNIGEETLMRDDLRILGILPTTSPYSDGLSCSNSVFNNGGTSGNGTTGDDIVDWVFIELRDKIDASLILYERSALLQRDGSIVAEDGVSDITVVGVYDDYFLAIKHRNHLGIMSSSTIALNGITTTADFTNGGLNTIGTNAQVTLDSGITALWGGDLNGDGQVRYLGPNNDTNFLKNTVVNEPGNNTNSNFYPFTGYDSSDLDMNGQIRYLGPTNDTNTLKFIVLGHPSNGTLSNFFPFTTQIPN